MKIPKKARLSGPGLVVKVDDDFTVPRRYDLLLHCDTECSNDCMVLKKYNPFEVLLQCNRYLCNCYYNLTIPISMQSCTEDCAENCAYEEEFTAEDKYVCIQR